MGNEITTLKSKAKGVFKLKKDEYMCENCRSTLKSKDFEYCPYCEAKIVEEDAYNFYKLGESSESDLEKIENYTLAIDSDPTFYLAYFNRGFSFLRVGMNNEAINDIDKAKSVFMNNINILKRVGGVFGRLGRFDKAEETYKRVLEIKPSDLDSLRLLAVLYGEMKRRDEQISHYEQVLNLAKDDLPSLKELGKAYLDIGEFERAVEVLSSAIKQDRDPALIINRGVAYKHLKKDSKAASDYIQAIKILNLQIESDEENIELIKTRALLNIKFQMYKEAAVDLEILVATYPESQKFSMMLIEVLLKLEKFDEAENQINSHIEKFEGDNIAIYLKGKLLFDQGFYKEANSSFKEYMVVSGKANKNLLYLYGNSFEKMEMYKEAEEQYLKSFKQNESNIKVLKALISLYELMGQDDKVKRYLSLIVEIDHTSSEYVEKLLKIDMKLEDFTEAEIHLDRMIAQDGRGKHLGKVLDLYIETEQLDKVQNVEDEILELSTDKQIEILEQLIDSSRESTIVKIAEGNSEIFSDKRFFQTLFNIYQKSSNDEKIVDLIEAVKLENLDDESKFLVGTYYVKVENPEGIELLSTLETSIDDPQIKQSYVELQFKIGDFSKVIELTSDPDQFDDSEQIYLLRGRAFLEVNKNLKSLRVLNEGFKKGFEHKDFYRYRAEANFKLERYSDSLDDMDKVKLEDFDDKLLELYVESSIHEDNYQRGFTLASSLEHLEQFRDSRRFIYLKSLMLHKLEKNDYALSFIEKNLTKYPEYMELVKLRGNIYFELEKFDKASEDLYRVVESDKDDSDSKLKLLETYFKLGLSNSLEAYIEETLDQYPDDPRFLKFKLLALFSQKKYSEVIKLEERVGKKFDLDMVLTISNSYLQVGDYQKCIEYVQDKADEYHSWELYNILGKAYNFLHEKSKALSMFNEALNVEDDHEEPISSRAMLNFELGNYNEAIDDFLRIPVENKLPFSTDKFIAQCYDKLEKYSDAISYYSKSIERMPEDYNLYSSRASSYIGLKKYDKAIKDLTIAIDHDPKNLINYLNRSNCYLELMLYQEAIKDYNIILGSEHESLSVLINRGNCFYYLGEYESALEDYTRVLEYDDERDDIRFLKSKILFNKGDAKLALEDIQLISDNFDKDKLLPLKGEILLDLNMYKDALEIYNSIIESNPENPNFCMLRGVTYNRLELYEDAVNDFNRAEELKGDLLSDENLGKLYLERGKANYELGNSEKYDEDFKHSEDLLTNSDILLFEKLQLLFNRGEWENCLELANKISENYAGNKTELLEIKMVLYIKQNKLDDAIKIVDKLRESDYENVDYNRSLGDIYFLKKNYRDAIIFYSKVLGSEKKDLNTLISRSKSFYEMKDYKNSVEDLDIALEIKGGDINLYRLRAKAKLKQSDLKGSLADYLSMLEIDHENKIAIQRAGKIYMELGELDKAKELFLKACELDNKTPKPFYMLGDIYFQEGSHRKAIESYEKALAFNIKKVKVMINLAHLYYMVKDYDKSLDQYEKAISIDPNNAEIYKNRSKLYLEMGDSEKGLKDIEKAIELDPKNPDLQVDKVHLNLKSGDIKDFLEGLDKAIEHSDLPDLRRRRAEYYFSKKEYKLYIDDLEKINSIYLSATDISRRAIAYYKLKDYGKAVMDYTSLLELENSNPDLLYKRANNYMLLKDYENAIKDYERVVEAIPGLMIAYAPLSFAYASIGEVEKSEKLQSKFVEYTHMMPFKKRK